MKHLDLLVFVFELVILFACSTSCASVVVLPTIARPSQDDPPPWRAVSDMAAAAAAAATEEFCPSLSSETIQVIHVAARAATAATAAALGRSPLGLSGAPPCQSTSASASAANDPGVGRQEDAVAGSGAAGSGRRGDVARASGGVLHGRGGYERGTGASSGGVELPGSAEGRKPRTPIPLGSKLALIDIADAGHT